MPHSTSSGSYARESSVPRSNAKYTDDPDSDSGLEKFPDHIDSPAMRANGARSMSPAGLNAYGIGLSGGAHLNGDRWQPRRDLSASRGVRFGSPLGHLAGVPRSHGRQKSISEAFRTIRDRSGSVSQNAHELADALRAPISPKLIGLCMMWYMSSALTNTSSKSILNAFNKPATLTMIQFFLVAFYCLTLSWLASVFPNIRSSVPALKNPIRYPSRDVIMTTLPLALFQIGGHLLSSTATSKIPVSMVHTVKGLSPLFTVFAYRFIFDIRYPRSTYLSLIPLTLGVMLACSSNHTFKGEILGLVYALLATIIFVTQNIFSKRLFNEAAKAEEDGQSAKSRKLDKLNLLCYSSGLAFLLTSPIWFWSEGIGLIRDVYHDGSVDLSSHPDSFDHGRLALEFLFNGTFHFGQNILAFVLLSLVSPVTYSVASLIKRVWVITVAILWFRNPTTPIQAVGIGLTFLGLYLYDRTNQSNKADRRARLLSQSAGGGQPLLPLNTTQSKTGISGQAPQIFGSPMSMSNGSTPHPYTNGHSSQVTSTAEDFKKSDDVGSNGRQRGSSNAAWLPPGTKQEETWRYGDRVSVR
ncbi:TPT-domain-containing protein [Daldinia caldariorum]|uniref:TPT-domain-containing protein n=1 Tax=Daldinia caldariorum TaxID=326644 RepID=UPI0020071F60|nr:TPT-domain-containing protein [Daldinia caldariorum]KAI1471311.1 TPT-domain-containing protein [Daldinia caldariorum]